MSVCWWRLFLAHHFAEQQPGSSLELRRSSIIWRAATSCLHHLPPWPCFCPLGPSQDIGSFLCHGSTMSAAISEPPAPADPAPWDALPNGVLLVPPEDLCSRSLLCCYQFPKRPTKQSSPLIRLLPFHCFVFSLWYFDIFLLLSFIGVRLSLSLGSTFQWSQGFCSRPHP